jgi:hypothetical protein
MKSNWIASVVLAAACMAPAVFAQGMPGATVRADGPPPMADKGLSPEERKARMEACKADPEKCRAERRARREQWCKENPQRCAEMKQKMEQRRAECEANPEKCRAEKRARRDQWCKENPQRCEEMKKRTQEQKRPDKGAALERFKRADTDGNGVLSRAEAEKSLPRLYRRFDHVDANRDGQISLDELAAARKARLERRRAVERREI